MNSCTGFCEVLYTSRRTPVLQNTYWWLHLKQAGGIYESFRYLSPRKFLSDSKILVQFKLRIDSYGTV